MKPSPSRNLLLPALAVLLAAGMACALPGRAPNADQIILEPTLPPAAAATQAPPSEPSPAPTSEPEMASSIFRDDFDGTMDTGWSWFKSPDPGYSLTHTPGWLRLNLSGGSFLAATPPENLLLRPAPGGDFDLRTYVRFSPYNNFDIAGLAVVFDDHSVLQFGRGGCFLETPSASCIGDGLYFDNIQGGAALDSNFAVPAALGVDYVLRLQRQGNTYSASYSTDGSSWQPVGSHTVDQAPLSVGLIAAQSTVAAPYADFDWFEMESH